MSLHWASCCRSVMAVGVGAVLAFPALADPVSSAFDGRYQGSGQLQAHLSQVGCQPGPQTVEIAIAKGVMRGRAADGGRVDGIVTADGFFTGTLRFADGASGRFEGRIDGGALIGSVIKRETCTYLLTLAKD